MFKIIYKRNKCNGCSYCINQAPEFFNINNIDGKADLYESNIENNYHTITVTGSEVKKFQDLLKLCTAKSFEIRKIK